MKPRFACFCSVLFVTFAASIPSQSGAAELHWDGTDTTADADGGAGSWTTGGDNWDDAATAGNATPWADNDIAIFGGTGGAVTLGGAITANGLTFNSTGYSISGNTLTLGANPVIVTNTGETATISSIIAGSAGLTKLGNGIFVLGGDNTYTGGTTVSAGTLRFSNPNQLEGATSIATGAILEFNPTGTSNTVGNAFTGLGTIKVNMAGAAAGGLTMGSINGFTGTIELAAASATGDKLIMNGQVTAANVIAGNGTSLYKTGSNATIGSLSISGTGNNENRGAIRLEAGTLTVTNGTTLLGNTTFGTSGGILAGTLRGTATTGNTQTLTLGTTNTNGSVTLSGIISDGANGGKLALNIGAVNMGDISLQGANTYSGGTTINFGRVNIGANSTALGTSTVTVVGDGTVGDGQLYAGAATLANNFIISGFGGNTVDATQRGAIRLDGGNINGTVTLAGNAAIGANTGTGTINGQITGGFFLRKVDGGTISLTNGTNAYSGGTQVNAGTLSFSNGALGTTGNVTMGGGTLRWNAGNTQDISSRLVRSATATYDTNGNDVTLASGIGTGTTMVNKSGAGTLTLTGFNNSTGGIEVLGGVLSVNNIADTGTTSQIGNLTGNHIAAKNGGTFRYNGLVDASTSRNLWVDTGVGGTIEVTNAATTLSFTGTGGNINKVLTKTGAGTLTVADDINSAGGGVTVNAGTLNLTNANNSYTAATTINGGTLLFGGAAGAATGISATTIGGGGTLRLDNSTASIGNRFGEGAITMNGGTISYFHNGAVATDYSETLGALTVANGINTVSTSQAASGQTSKLTFASLSRTAGSVNFVGAGLGATVDTSNEIAFTAAPTLTAGIIGSWATINGTDLATLSGNSLVTYSGYTDIDARGPSSIPDLSGANVRIFGDGTSGNIDLAATTTTVNSLLMSNANFAATVDTASKNLLTGGVILASGAQALTIGAAADDGTLQTNSAGGILNLNNQSVTNAVTVNAVIADNTSASGLLKVGSGLATLAGTNSYTGVTTIGEGVLAVAALADGGASSGVGASTNAQANLVIGNATLRYTGNTASSNRGFTLAAGTTGAVDVSTSGQTLTLSGGTANTTGNLVKSGAGNLTLSGVSQHSGTTNVTGGVLTIANTLRNSAGFTVGTGATLEFGATNIFVAGHGVAVADSRVITVDGGTLLFNSSADFRFGNVTLSNGATWTSNRVLTNYDALLANTTAGAATVNVTGTGASTMNGSGGIHLQGVQNFNVADVTGNASTDLTVSMILAAQGTSGGAAGGINKLGAGTMTLTGANTYTGGTNITEGILNARIANGQNALGTGTATVGTGTILNLDNVNTGSDTSVANLFSGAGTINLIFSSGNTARNTRIGTINALDSFTGSLVLSLPSGTTGDKLADVRGTTAASLTIGSGTQLFAAAAAGVTFNGGITVSGTGNSENRGAIRLATTLGGNINLAGNTSIGTEGGTLSGNISTSTTGLKTLTFGTNTGGNATANGNITDGSGSIALTKTQAGTLTLNGSNSYSGTTLISGGILQIGSGGTTGSLGSGSVTNNATLRFDRSNDLSVSNIISGSGAVIKNGAGTLTLTGANTYAGATSVNAGRLISGNTSSTSSSVIASGAVLELNHTTGTPRSYSVTTSFSGAGTLEKTGAGTVQFTGAATFQMGSGSLIDVRAGTFTAANGANEKWRTGTGPFVYNLSDLNVESGATFNGVEASATADGGIFVDELRGTGTINVGFAAGYSNTLTFGIDNGTASFGGALAGNGFGNFVKTGSGTQTLTGTSTSTGTMAVNGGRLNVNGTIANVTTNVGNSGTAGTLAGDGQINGALVLGANGTLLPGQGGATDRTLTINGNVTTTAGSVISFTVDAMNNHDQLVISGANTLGLSNADLQVDFNNALTFDILGAGQGDDFLAALDSFAGTGSWFKLISGNTTGMFSNVTDTLTSGELSYFGLTGTQYKTTIEGQSFWVAQGSTYLVAIPEPRVAFLGGIGLLMLLRRRRA